MFNSRLLWIGVALWFLWHPVSGEAQSRRKETDKTPAGYREAVDTALQEVTLGNYEEAREQFARAHALFPNARTLRGLGIAEFELRHYVVAAEYLEQALASNVKPMEGTMRRDTDSLLARAKTYIGELTINVEPSGAQLLVDAVRDVSLSSEPVRLDVGEHVLEFRADGYSTERRHVTVRGGQAVSLSLQLAPLVSQAPRANESVRAALPPPAEAQRSERVPVYKRWWLWTVIGVVVAGAAAGTVVALNSKPHTQYRAVPTDNTPTGANLQPLWRY